MPWPTVDDGSVSTPRLPPLVVEQPADLIGHVEQERLDGGVAVQNLFQRHPERRFQAGTLILAGQGREDRPGQGDEAQREAAT